MIGLNLYSTLSALTSQLVGRDHNAIPSLLDIANLAMRITGRYAQDLGINQGEIPAFEGAIFGWCRTAESFQLVHFRPAKKTDSTITPTIFDLNSRGSIFLMGDATEEIRHVITIAREKTAGLDLELVPMYAIQRIIREKRHWSIGGSLQLGRGSSKGFYLFPTVLPTVRDEKVIDEVTFRGLGLYDDIGRIGPCTAMLGGRT